MRLPNSTPEAAAALVRYVNVDMQYSIKYWSIGNEPSLYEQDTSLKGQAWDAVTYAKRWREFALAMKATDSEAIRIGVSKPCLRFSRVGYWITDQMLSGTTT